MNEPPEELTHYARLPRINVRILSSLAVAAAAAAVGTRSSREPENYLFPGV